MKQRVMSDTARGASGLLRRLCLLLTLSVLVMASAMVDLGGRAVAQDASSATGIAIVDGVEVAVAPGDTVAQGQLTTEGDHEVCVMPETTIGASNDGSVSNFSVRAQVTADCQLVIVSVNKTQAAGAADASLLATRWSGGWYDHLDAVGLLLTESYAALQYNDTGSSVSASYQETLCRNALDGWYGNWSDQNWSPGGPSSVWIWKLCNFSFVGGTYTHTLTVDVYSWPGDAWDVYCDHWGSTAPSAQFDCGGNHW